MNPMYVDPYIRISHNRHWLTSNAKKNKHNKDKSNLAQTTKTTNAAANILKKKNRHLQQGEKFNPEVIDTFCFHWPDMHSYVLVRVLESTIAILPVRSRLAFLYFHHAPLPTHPSPKDLRKALQPVAAANSSSKRIHDMFISWKHTLVIGEEQLPEVEEEEDLFSNKSDSNSSSDDNNTTNNSSSTSTPINNITETPPSTPKMHSNVTLSDVLSYEGNLRNGWIHAPCTVDDDKNMFDNNVILTTKHTELRLTARCFSEKMMFMNLVKLKHIILQDPSLDIDNTNKEDHDEDSDVDDDYNSTHPTTHRPSSKFTTNTIGM